METFSKKASPQLRGPGWQHSGEGQ